MLEVITCMSVIKSCDTVDRSIMDCALGRLGLPSWFREGYFACSLVLPPECGLYCYPCMYPGAGGWRLCPPLSPSFTLIILSVVLCVPMPYLVRLGSLLNMPGLSVGQDVPPGKCVLLSTFKAVRKSIKLWDVSGDGQPCKVELDVGDLGCHLTT